MITKKNGSKLVFFLEDGSTVQYDLATQKTIGKRGKPVKTLKSQLSGLGVDGIIETIEQESYRNFLRWVRRQNDRSLYNFGSVLEVAKQYSNYEQYFAAGITDFDKGAWVKFGDIPKGLLKILRDYGVKLTREVFECYIAYPDAFTTLMKEQYNTLTVQEGVQILCYGMSTYSWVNDKRSRFFRMVEDYNYNAKALLQYIDNIMSFEALHWRDTLSNIFDYAKMMSDLSPKFEKYPRYLHTTHDIAVRNYGRLKQEHDEKMFSETVREDLDKNIEDWAFICAKTTQDIKDEAVQQNNCVAGYISYVLKGECHIVFMRKKEYRDKSVVTLEVRNNKVAQSRGKFNRDPTEKEREVLAKYSKYLSKIGEEENEKLS